jgi:hypothetical protein
MDVESAFTTKQKLSHINTNSNDVLYIKKRDENSMVTDSFQDSSSIVVVKSGINGNDPKILFKKKIAS